MTLNYTGQEASNMVKIEITDSYEAVAVLDAIVRFEVGEFPSDSSGRSTAERMVAYMKFMDTPTGKIILDLLQGDLGEVAMTVEVTDPFTVDPEMKWSTHDFEESVKQHLGAVKGVLQQYLDERSQVPADTFGTCLSTSTNIAADMDGIDLYDDVDEEKEKKAEEKAAYFADLDISKERGSDDE